MQTEFQASKAQETGFFFVLASALADAREKGDAAAIFEARDDLEVLQLRTANPELARRAGSLLSAV